MSPTSVAGSIAAAASSARNEQREALEFVLVQGAAGRIAEAPQAAEKIAEGIKAVLDALHPLPGAKPATPPYPDLEQAIQAHADVAPRVTPADIEAEIVSEHYFTAANGAREGLYGNHQIGTQSARSLALLTFCVLVLRNGFTGTGESACVSPENFNAEIGRQVARENAVEKLWPLLGFRLRDRLAGAAAVADSIRAGIAAAE